MHGQQAGRGQNRRRNRTTIRGQAPQTTAAQQRRRGTPKSGRATIQRPPRVGSPTEDTPSQGEGEGGPREGRREETRARTTKIRERRAVRQRRADEGIPPNLDQSERNPFAELQEALSGRSGARTCRCRAPGGEGKESRVKAMPDDSLRPLWGLRQNLCVLEAAPQVMSVWSQGAREFHGLRVMYGPSELSFSHIGWSSWWNDLSEVQHADLVGGEPGA